LPTEIGSGICFAPTELFLRPRTGPVAGSDRALFWFPAGQGRHTSKCFDGFFTGLRSSMAPFHRDSRLNGNSTNSASTSIDPPLNFLIVHQVKPEQQAMWPVAFRLVSTLHVAIDRANPRSPLPHV
jgi:hypothetical protein